MRPLCVPPRGGIRRGVRAPNAPPYAPERNPWVTRKLHRLKILIFFSRGKFKNINFLFPRATPGTSASCLFQYYNNFHSQRWSYCTKLQRGLPVPESNGWKWWREKNEKEINFLLYEITGGGKGIINWMLKNLKCLCAKPFGNKVN